MSNEYEFRNGNKWVVLIYEETLETAREELKLFVKDPELWAYNGIVKNVM